MYRKRTSHLADFSPSHLNYQVQLLVRPFEPPHSPDQNRPNAPENFLPSAFFASLPTMNRPSSAIHAQTLRKDFRTSLGISLWVFAIGAANPTFATETENTAKPADYQSIAQAFKPNQSTIPAPRPENAIVLLDKDTCSFVAMSGQQIDWPSENGILTSRHHSNRVNHIASTWHFRDADIHVEFNVDAKGDGNSGIYIHGNYELQILNTAGKPDVELSDQDQGAVYGFNRPITNAAKPAGEWQVYDIRYIAPRRNDNEEITTPGSITAWLNGVLVQNNFRFEEPRSVYHPFRYGTTPYLKAIVPKLRKEQVGPVFLQDHESPTQFRNVWIVPLDDQATEYQPAN